MSDWQTEKLSDIGMFSKGAGIPKDSARSGDLPAVRYGELYTSFDVFVRKPKSYIDQATAEASVKVVKGDILFAGSGETIDDIGKSAVYEYYQEGYAGGDIVILRPDLRQNTEFLGYALNSEVARKQLRRLGQGQSVVHIYRKDLELLELSLPEKSEQERIVGVLEVWDEYIEKLEQKIALKEQLKKGLMQQLLTGKHRLPGFSSEWKKAKVSDVFDFISTYSHSKAQMTYQKGGPDSIYCIHYGDIHTKFDSYIEINKHNVPHLLEYEHIPRSKLLRQGDIVVADASEDYEGVGNSVEIENLSQRQCIAGLHTFALRAKGDFLSHGFGALIFRNENVHRSLTKIATYSKVYGITKTGFADIKITIPSLDEQARISHILKTLNEEVEQMSNKKEHLNQQKKYLLKNLITGTIRTPETLQPKGAN